jgi:hypothetical protein
LAYTEKFEKLTRASVESGQVRSLVVYAFEDINLALKNEDVSASVRGLRKE